MTRTVAGIALELPARYAHWHPALAARLAAATPALQADLARWPEVPGPVPRLRVCASPAEAALLLQALDPAADPRVPRTFPARAFALVPLPRDDALLAALADPPDTFVHSVLHEAAHLRAAARPALDAAPLWFQEGLAEAHSGAPPGAVVGPEQASEARLARWRARAESALRADAGPAPWQSAVEPSAAATEAELAAGIRGRDAHADPARGLWFAASLPEQVVEVDLPPLAPGAALRLSLQVGSSGEPDGGLRLRPAAGPALRLRCDAAGGLAAWEEDPARPWRSDSGDRAAITGPPPARTFVLEHHGDELAIRAADGFVRRFPLAAGARAYPVALTLYVRDGACAARAQP